MRPNMLPLSNMITTILILLLAASCSAVGNWPFPVPADTFLGMPKLTCKLSLNLLDPCFPLSPLEPSPACCEAVAPLENKISQMNLCYCLKELQTAGASPNITQLGILFSSCGVSVKLPPVPIPEDIDEYCTEYVLDGDSTVGSYWAMEENPTGGYHWQLRFRMSTYSKNRNGNENDKSDL